MANIDIHNLSGAKVGTLELADEIFGAVNEDLLWEAVKHYRAAQRAGTHATKNKKLVSGAGKKLWKQKGTGPPVLARSVHLCGVMAVRYTDRSQGLTITRFRARNCWGHCVRLWLRSLPMGN